MTQNSDRDLHSDDAIVVWGLTGLTVLVVLLFLLATSFQPPAANGDDHSDEGIDETPGDNENPDEEPDMGNIPAEIAHFTRDSVSISDTLDYMLIASQGSTGGFRPGIPVAGGGHGGGGGGGGNVTVFDAIVRVVPNPVPSPGLDVQAFAITNASSATNAIFELFGPECLPSGGISCTAESDLSELSPPSFNGTLPQFCNGNLCEEYSVIIPGEHLDVKGEYQVKVTFFDSNHDTVAIKDMNFRVQSFFVVPESQLGVIALLLSSFGIVLFMYYWKAMFRKIYHR